MNQTTHYLMKKAKAGDTDAQYQLGLVYCTRNQIAPATAWLKQAAFAGHSDALDTLRELKTHNLVEEEEEY